VTHTPDFKFMPLYDAGYLSNCWRYDNSCYGMRIGNVTKSFEWYHFQWP